MNDAGGNLRRFFGTIVTILLLSPALPAGAQTIVRPGFNLFTPAQDVEIGRQSAAEAERQMPMLADAAANRYVSSLGDRLAAQAPGPRFTYHFQVVNASEINAFALPGGYVYVNRGLLERVRTEGELAAVMAHEIAHVALRHPTNQLSKAYVAKAGLGILGGLFGQNSGTGAIVNGLGGFGLNTLFLKFSRSVESQADIVGAQIMARGGYDPIEMAHFFSFLGQQAGQNPSKVARFLSDHPAPADREARVRQEARLLAVHAAPPIGQLAAVQGELHQFAPASSAPVAQNSASSGAPPVPSAISIERPSMRYRIYRQRDGLFQLEQPDNWSASAPASGYGVTIAPRGGVVRTADGRQSLACGIIVNHYVPFDGSVGAASSDPRGSGFGADALEEATRDLVRQVVRANPYLQPVAGSAQRSTIAGRPSYSLDLAGGSPTTGEDERVTVLTRQLADGHIIYALEIAPASADARLTPAFRHMIESLRVNEGVAHQ